jgi:DNA-binding MarR family transcriptional regulator
MNDNRRALDRPVLLSRSVPPRRSSVAFLLAQVGALAAERFGERAATIGLSRAQAGLLRAIASSDAPLTQQALATNLDLAPSRLVVLVDELADAGVLERRPVEDDRRAYAVHLTAAGKELFAKLAAIGREHEHTFTSALTESERAKLGELLQKLADAHGLRAGVHPGYRAMEASAKRRKDS